MTEENTQVFTGVAVGAVVEPEEIQDDDTE
jgi:hypothetical protein